MRRSIVLKLLLAAACAAAIWVLAVAGSAGAAPHIVCPEQRPNVIPCCGPPVNHPNKPQVQSICCEPAACCQNTTTACCTTTCCPQPTTSGTCCSPTLCGSTLTIAASPSPSRAAQKVVISGTAASGAQVALWRKLAHQSSFHQFGAATADSSGKYTFTLKRGTVMADQEWYVTSNGAQSQTITQQVDALVALASSARSTTVGRRIVLSGRVTPSHAGEMVLVEMSRGGTWQVIARPRLGHGSGYSASHRFARAGAVKLRVVLQGDSRNDRSTSSTLTLKVKP
jgi:hypothetical protein